MKGINGLIFLWFVYCNCSLTTKHLTVKQFSEPKIDTTVTVEVRDSLHFVFKNHIGLGLSVKSLNDSTRTINLVILNISNEDIFVDTLNLDQFKFENSHTFYYGPDVNCYLPMYFFPLSQERDVAIKNLEVDNDVDTVNIFLSGTRNLNNLKNEVRGKLDTIHIQNSFNYCLSYDCKSQPKVELFSIEITKIPIKSMNGLVKIRIKGI